MTTRSAPPASAPLSILAKRDAWAEITTGVADSRRSLQLVAVACGSRSTMAEDSPARAAATAMETLTVVLPEPPFWAMTEIVCILMCYLTYT